MQRLFKIPVLAGIIVLICTGTGLWWLHARGSSKTSYRMATVKRGDVAATISATGTIEPVEVVAVGARAWDILRQFLVEAVVLCLAGGIAGILLGRGASTAITALLHWPTIASLSAIIAAVTVSVTVGLVFGYYPAWKASRLDPIEALRYE